MRLLGALQLSYSRLLNRLSLLQALGESVLIPFPE